MRSWSIIMCLLLATFDVVAQFTSESSKIKVEGGLLNARAEDSELNIDGGIFGASYERKTKTNFSYNLSLAYLSVKESGTRPNNVPVAIDYSSLPVTVGVNYYLTQNRLASYIGGGIGIHFSNLSTDNNPKQSDRGMAITVPVGIDYYVLKNVAVGFNYRFYYLGSSYLSGGLMHTINLGLGFTFW